MHVYMPYELFYFELYRINQFNCLKPLKAMYQISEIKISYSPRVKNIDREKISSSQQVYNLVLSDWDEINIRETMKVLFLNRANKVIGIYELSKGGITGTVVDIRLLFAAVLKSLSCSIILLHNHPSGNLKPSEADIHITNKIKDAGKLLDIQILDHLIITEDEYFSFTDQGII